MPRPAAASLRRILCVTAGFGYAAIATSASAHPEAASLLCVAKRSYVNPVLPGSEVTRTVNIDFKKQEVGMAGEPDRVKAVITDSLVAWSMTIRSASDQSVTNFRFDIEWGTNQYAAWGIGETMRPGQGRDPFELREIGTCSPQLRQ